MSRKKKLEPCEGGPVDPQLFDEVAGMVGQIIEDCLFDDEHEFEPCARCDGHDACEDFGCAFDLGLGHLVNDIYK